MKVLLFSANFASEPIGIGKYSGEMAAWLATQEHQVRVVAAPLLLSLQLGAGFAWPPYRHNDCSRFEAQQIINNRKAGEGFSWVKAFTAKDLYQRRYHQKELFYWLPFRPLVKFLLLYVGKRGFLDGRAGITYAVLQAIYEYFIVLTVREFESAAQSSIVTSI